MVDQCLDHCLLLEQNPKIEIIAPPTKAPMRAPVTQDNGDIDDLNFHLSKRKPPKDGKHHSTTMPLATPSTTELPSELNSSFFACFDLLVFNFYIENFLMIRFY